MGWYDDLKKKLPWASAELTVEQKEQKLDRLRTEKETLVGEGDANNKKKVDSLKEEIKKLQQEIKGAKIPASTSLRAEHRSWAFAT